MVLLIEAAWGYHVMCHGYDHSISHCEIIKGGQVNLDIK